jgi:hypothetical protein
VKQARPSRGRDKRFAQKRYDEQEGCRRAARGMSVEHADRAGHLAHDTVGAVRNTSDEESGMDVAGSDELGQQQQRRHRRRYTAPDLVCGGYCFWLGHYALNAAEPPEGSSRSAISLYSSITLVQSDHTGNQSSVRSRLLANGSIRKTRRSFKLPRRFGVIWLATQQRRFPNPKATTCGSRFGAREMAGTVCLEADPEI